MSDLEFERRLARALGGPVPADARANMRAKAAIMDRIREAARTGRPRKAASLPLGRTTRHSLIGLAMAAGIGSITTIAALRDVGVSPRTAGAVTSVVIGDSVVEGFRDTLRLVRLMFDDAGAKQVAVAGDFNAWNHEATRMQRDERTGRWSVTLALHDGEHRYAIVVDATRLAGDALAPRAGNATGHVHSVLHVARSTN